MLPATTSLQELRDYLDAESLRSKCETSNEEIFLHFVDGRHLDAQNSYGTLPVDARFWIGYDAAANEFVLNVNFFTHEGIGITREQFGESVAETNPAVTYTSDVQVRWISSDTNVYTINYPMSISVARYFENKIPTITKIA